MESIIEFSPNGFGEATKSSIYAKNAKHHANGQIKSFDYGNGLTYNRTLDSSQRPYNLTVRNGSTNKLAQRYIYDHNNNVDYIDDLIDSTYDIDLAYDGLNRLTSATGKWGSGNVNYDALGNIESKTIGSHNLNYQYNSKNQLTTITGSKAYSFNYDSRGNTTYNGHYSLTYNLANQLTAARNNSYLYDGHNRLVKKVTPNKTVYSMYSLDGTLYHIEEGSKKTDYIRLGSELVAKDDRAPTVSPPNSYVKLTTPPINLNGYVSSCAGFPISRCVVKTTWQHSTSNQVQYYELYIKNSLSATCNAFEKCLRLDVVSLFIDITPIDSWTKEYSGSTSSTSINTNSEKITVKVRACNPKGCSPYSAERTIIADGSI